MGKINLIFLLVIIIQLNESESTLNNNILLLDQFSKNE